MAEQNKAPAKILFRADGNAAIGWGHLRRCLALACQLHSLGCECIFVCKAAEDSINALVAEHGFELLELGDRIGSQGDDARATITAVKKRGPFAALVVDHYSLDARWHRALRPVAPRIVVVDDLADRQLDCELLIDPAPGDAARYDRLVPVHCRKLLGPTYALLRPEFAEWRSRIKPRSGKIGRILLSFGGTDMDNLTCKSISAIRRVLPDVAIDAVLTSHSPHKDRIIDRGSRDPGLTVHIDSPDMAALMAAADLAVGASGSTAWERACLGLPSIVTVVAENQRATALALEEYGCALTINADVRFSESLEKAVGLLSRQPMILRTMSAAGSAIVDGRGAIRAAAGILDAQVKVRPAKADDARKIWEWRNTEEVRNTAIRRAEIPWEKHKAWFASRLESENTVMLIGVREGNEVGFVRFDMSGDMATVSIFLAPNMAGRGVGSALLNAGEQWMISSHPHIRRFHADVRPENKASIALFKGALYSPSLISFERIING